MAQELGNQENVNEPFEEGTQGGRADGDLDSDSVSETEVHVLA